ncbi:MAG: phosphomannomutase/phosphoglucomutase [Planctomycetes bacterium]|nr:phosphomannomutase/phosphoglucomutase [Planctomycetota bacterium]
MGIFKAYDIRGLVPKELDAALARRIGRGFARLLEQQGLLTRRRLLVGRDMRTHSPEIAAAVIEGMRDHGCDVLDIGLASTPMAYFAIGSQDVDGGLNVTASHNPGEYNGMKLCSRGARPISAANGILEIEQFCRAAQLPPAARRGSVTQLDLLGAYADHVAGFARIERPITIGIDAANGMAGYTLPSILERLPNVRAKTLFMEPDGTFPNHEANPLKEENLDGVRELVRREKLELGVGFDGDADRCCFVDETGRTVAADLMTAILARELLAKKPSRPVVYDLRSSWVVKEEIARAGGVPLRDRVGHSFIKATMRNHGAIFGGELSGHFYFADNFTSDSGVIAMVTAMNLLSREPRLSLSQRAAGLRRYFSTGEINFHVEDKQAAIAALKLRYADARQDELDGITLEYGDLKSKEWWWCNVRPSNTEPLLRLNLEASSAALRELRRNEVVALLGEPEA